MGRTPIWIISGAAALTAAAWEPATAQSVRDLQARARTAETEARQRQEAAQAAKAEAERLALKAEEAAERRAAAHGAISEAERRIAAQTLVIARAGRVREEGRARLERALMGLSQAEAARASQADGATLALFAASGATMRHQADARLRAAESDLRLAAFERDRVSADLAALGRHEEAALALSAQRAAEGKRLMAQAEQSRAQARRLSAQARSLAELARTAGRERPRTATASAQSGARQAPVAGRVAVKFGRGAGTRAQGVVIAAAPGAAVTAPASGTISFAGPFMDYGEVLILERRDGYALILAGLGETRVAIGQAVSAGEVIGALPRAVERSSELYFEVRRQGTPVDPERWLPVELKPQTGARLASRTASNEAGVRR